GTEELDDDAADPPQRPDRREPTGPEHEAEDESQEDRQRRRLEGLEDPGQQVEAPVLDRGEALPFLRRQVAVGVQGADNDGDDPEQEEGTHDGRYALASPPPRP